MKKIKDERVKQLVIGAGILVSLTVAVPSVLIGWRFLPGLLGEWLGTMIGIVTTPFFMEASFAMLGLAIVIFLNHWRQQRDGDEFVYLEQVVGPNIPSDLPEHAKWAVYLEKPLDSPSPSPLAQAEGAIAIGDYPAATAWIGTMSAAELKLPETLRVRRDLARATGRGDLVAQLDDEIQRADSHPS